MVDVVREEARKRVVEDIFDALAAGRPFDRHQFCADYRPHSAPFPGTPQLSPGADALLARRDELGVLALRVHRVVADGDRVWVHVRYETDVPVAGIDIFSFDAVDRVVEHWNIRQAIPHDDVNRWDRFGGGGGTRACVDDARRGEMKELLTRSQVDVWGLARHDLVPVYYDEAYVQHNSDMPGGYARILELVTHQVKPRFDKSGQPVEIDFRLVSANGDLVFIYYSVPITGIGRNEGEFALNADIFRISADNKLTEHWDVLQMASDPVPDERTFW